MVFEIKSSNKILNRPGGTIQCGVYRENSLTSATELGLIYVLFAYRQPINRLLPSTVDRRFSHRFLRDVSQIPATADYESFNIAKRHRRSGKLSSRPAWNLGERSQAEANREQASENIGNHSVPETLPASAGSIADPVAVDGFNAKIKVPKIDLIWLRLSIPA
ncbi:hypothetical protein DSO57_1018479 [Entomophthora muscae]|uniref:Uncharacterized protein n=1 Tax=Entomophthora muscae TaxID=34485 RepID=A0ACC2RVD1_9FUNG|nr:hypothetical protein DSO57_1018479 [Entomophthora muscae]